MKAESVTEELIALDYKSVWQCHTQDFSMDKIVPKHVQQAIEIITFTKLVEDLNGQAIHVHAQSQEDCDKAINKLDVLRKYHVSVLGTEDSSLPLTREGSCTSSYPPPLPHRGERSLRAMHQISARDWGKACRNNSA
jgi:hypothetical protein